MDKISEDTKLKKDVPKYNDSVGIRATLNNLGVSDSSIGYDENNKTVTIGGKAFMKPTYMDEDAGISYAPESAIRQNLVDFYKDSSNPIVRVSDAYATAAGKYGLDASALTYGNNTVMIGGVPLNTLYIDDSGKAWAWQNDVYDLTEKYADNVGVSTPESVYNNTKKYLSNIESAIKSLYNQSSFSYDPDDDPVYMAYRDKYMLEGNRATQDTMANYSALTGGYVNSAAVTAGALANQYYSQQLTDKIPELAKQAYDRYNDDRQANISLIDRMISAYNSAYNNLSNTNDTARKYANATADSVTERDEDAYEQYWTELLNQQAYDTQAQKNYWENSNNIQNQLMNSYKIQGYILDNEEKEISNSYLKQLLEAEIEESRANTYAKYYK